MDNKNNVKSNTAYSTYPTGEQGSGIGLALTKELVELHHGRIDVKCTNAKKHPPQSPPVGGSASRLDPLNRGELSHTTFTILLPIGKEDFNQEEIIEKSSSAELIDHSQHRIPSIQHPASSIPEKSGSPLCYDHKSAYNILLVEDNRDVTTYIRSFLETDYRILTAENGKAAWKKALDK